MTLAEIVERAQRRLDEDDSVSLRYVAADLETIALQGARFYVAKTGCRNATTTITAVADQLFYDLPCDIVKVNRVLWNSDSALRPLTPKQSRELDAEVAMWQEMSDVRSRHYFLLGLKQIALWPMSTVGGEEYIIHYSVDEYDAVSVVPVEDHECLVDYVVARSLLNSGKAADGIKEYAKYKKCVDASRSRMSSADRTWGMQ